MKFKQYTKDKFGRETKTALVIDEPIKNNKPVKGFVFNLIKRLIKGGEVVRR